MRSKQVNIKRQSLKKSDHIVKEIVKMNSINKEEEIIYSPRRIKLLIKQEINDTKLSEEHIENISVDLLESLKQIFLEQTYIRWDNEHQMFLQYRPLVFLFRVPPG